MLLQHTVDLSQSQTDWLQCVEGKSAQKTGIFKDQMSLRGTHGLITCLVQSGKYPFSPSGATIVQNTVLEFRRQICVHNSAFHYDRFILQDPTKKDSKRHELNDSKQFWMNSNGLSWFFRHVETQLQSFQIIWSHLSHEVTKLAILCTLLYVMNNKMKLTWAEYTGNITGTRRFGCFITTKVYVLWEWAGTLFNWTEFQLILMKRTF